MVSKTKQTHGVPMKIHTLLLPLLTAALPVPSPQSPQTPIMWSESISEFYSYFWKAKLAYNMNLQANPPRVPTIQLEKTLRANQKAAAEVATTKNNQ